MESTSVTDRVEVQPGVFMPSDSEAYFHAPTMTEDDYRAWIADNVSSADDYASWVSGDGFPIRKIGESLVTG